MNMTKKKYVTPAIEVVEMESVSMFAVSDGGEMGGDFEEKPDEELSNRRRNYWNEVGGW